MTKLGQSAVTDNRLGSCGTIAPQLPNLRLSSAGHKQRQRRLQPPMPGESFPYRRNFLAFPALIVYSTSVTPKARPYIPLVLHGPNDHNPRCNLVPLPS